MEYNALVSTDFRERMILVACTEVRYSDGRWIIQPRVHNFHELPALDKELVQVLIGWFVSFKEGDSSEKIARE